jgi:hypothetical protein
MEGFKNLLLVFLMEVILYSSRHSDINLVEVGSGGVIKDEEEAVLLEGGGKQPASPTLKTRSSTASPSIIR